MRRTPASKASKEERASLARSDGQDGEGMRGSQGRREPSQGGAEKEPDLVSVLVDMFDIFTSLKIGTQVICRQVPTHEQSPQQEEPSIK